MLFIMPEITWSNCMLNEKQIKYIKCAVPTITFLVLMVSSNLSFAESKMNNSISLPTVSEKIFDKAKENNNWKLAFLTGKQAQIVFMNVTPKTNPKNEIGMETHEFDQVIIIVEGKGKSDLNGKVSNVNVGDLIFIPKGTAHNIINVDSNNPLKIISIYSETDIPANSVLKTSSDEPKE